MSLSLSTLMSSRNERRLALIIGGAILLISVCVIPYGTMPGPVMSALMPAVVTTSSLAELVTAYLLFSQFRENGSPSLATLAGTYLFTGLTMIFYVLTFPGPFSATGLFGAGTQTATWLWMAWHGGWSAGIILYALVDRFVGDREFSPERRRTTLIAHVIVVPLLTLGIVCGSIRLEPYLPLLIDGDNYRQVITSGVGPVIWVFNLGALLCVLRVIRQQAVAHLWLRVAVLASFLDVTVTLMAMSRYSVGWYMARLNGLFSAVFVLAALLYEVNRLYQARSAQNQRTREVNAELQRQRDELRATLLQMQRSEQSQRRLVTIVEAMPDLVGMLDRDGRWLHMNDAGRKLLGLDGELTGHLRDIYPEHTAGVVPAEAMDTALREGLWYRETTVLHRVGREVPVAQTVLAHRDEDGQAIYYSTIIRDLTERYRVERIKNEFLSIVSHELRTPLTSIRGSMGLLASGMLGPLSPRAQNMVDIAVQNSDRLTRLVSDILDLERLQSGNLVLRRQTTPLAQLMSQAGDEMRGLASKAGVSLQITPLDVNLRIDPDRIVQVLANLLSNAIKFSPAGGTVSLTAEQQDGRVVLRVSDRGRGIPADKLEAIFERFQQVDSSDSRDKGGSGLGLAICSNIVGQHGGRIWAESVLGEGSTFYVSLPVS